MGPATISLILLISATSLITAYLILPIFNMHLSINREALLKEKAQQVMQKNRLRPNQIKTELLQINRDISGIDFIDVQVVEKSQYIVAKITYKESNLFFNKFNKNEINQRRKSTSFIIDKVMP